MLSKIDKKLLELDYSIAKLNEQISMNFDGNESLNKRCYEANLFSLLNHMCE